MNRPDDLIVFNDPYEIVEFISATIRHAEAHKETSKRLKDAHDYVQRYCMPDGWNKNVWHTILDDAIRMREGR